MVKIYGVPEYAEGMNYIVCRETGYKEFWFWGAWNDRNEANEAALAIGGVVFDNI